jgi:peroxiredoxin
MSVRRSISLAVLLAFGVFPASATTPVPRKSPDLIIVEPSGKQTRLSSLKGKVVIIEFLVTSCPHCLRVAQTISKVQWEMGSRGLQSFGIAFDSGVNAELVTKFTQRLAITYPVGYVSSDKVDGYLGRSGTERFRIPQIVVIDRKGVIRAQSRPIGEKNLEDEKYLRSLIQTLLGESVSSR